MERHVEQGRGQALAVLLEVVAENGQDADPVAIGEVGRGVIDEVKQNGYAIEPVYTGQRGGVDLLFQVLTYLQTAAQTVGADVYAERDVINVISDLCTIFASVSPLAVYVLKARERYAAKQAAALPVEDHTIKIAIVIDGAPIAVEAADLQEAEAALKLAKRFHSAHPTVTAPLQKQVKIQVPVPKKKPRKRR